MRSVLHAWCAVVLVGLPAFALSTVVDRPAWMWLALVAFGSVVVFAALQHMARTVDYAREIGVLPEPEPAPPLRESYDKAVLSLIDALGLRPFFERLANWLARHLPGGRS